MVQPCQTTGAQSAGATICKTEGANGVCKEYDCSLPNGRWGPTYGNQFAKWVFCITRQITKLSARFDLAGNLHREPAWAGVDNYMVLDVDQRQGKGPETVTFQNPPPGTYQIVVDEFGQRGGTFNIVDANPKVSIWIGGNEIAFTCEMPRSCKSGQRFWVAAEVKIERMMTSEGTPVMDGSFEQYSIRIEDRKHMMAPLRAVNLPTDPAHGRVCRWKKVWVPRWRGLFAWGEPDYYDMVWEACNGGPEHYFYNDNYNYNDDDFKDVCFGSCRVAEGVPEGYDSCLAKNNGIDSQSILAE